MLHIVVDHRKGNADRKDCYNAECNSGVRDKLISLNSTVNIHLKRRKIGEAGGVAK